MSESNSVGPVEFRAAALDGVNVSERILTVVAVPYEETAKVVIDQRLWSEVFSRGAFAGIETRQSRIPVNRDHDMTDLIGKVVGAFPDRAEGLVLDLRVSKTPRGDETLELAADDVLSPSIGFAVRTADQEIDRKAMTRRVNRAFLDHLALVPVPAYAGAHVVAMREHDAQTLPEAECETDEQMMAHPIFDWAWQRLSSRR